MKPNNIKWIVWLKRYFAAEVLGLVTAYLGLIIYVLISSNPSNISASLIATWGENLGYYFVIFAKDFPHHPKNLTLIKRIVLTMKGIIFEFGVAEGLDSFVIRPFCLFWGIKLYGNELGLLLGKFTSDIIFYIPTIFFYELKNKH